MKISYLSEPVADYHKELDTCDSLFELRIFVEKWKLLANDAFDVAQAMTSDDWPTFRKGLKSERRGRYAGDNWTERYAAILLPEILFKVSMTANQFICPWGLAYCRHRDVGQIVEKNGVAYWNDLAKP